jgi:hypothetical protein
MQQPMGVVLQEVLECALYLCFVHTNVHARTSLATPRSIDCNTQPDILSDDESCASVCCTSLCEEVQCRRATRPMTVELLATTIHPGYKRKVEPRMSCTAGTDGLRCSRGVISTICSS